MTQEQILLELQKTTYSIPLEIYKAIVKNEAITLNKSDLGLLKYQAEGIFSNSWCNAKQKYWIIIYLAHTINMLRNG